MFIAVANQKGGVGKTTLAVHVACWHFERGRRVAFLDTDGQASSSRWIRFAQPEITVVQVRDSAGIVEIGRKLSDEFDIVVADGPANLAESTRALLLLADLALLPCGVTMPDLESTRDTVHIIRTARLARGSVLPSAVVVLNRLRNDRFALTREAPAAVAMLEERACRNGLRLREALADAPGQRTVVWRMGYRARAAATEMLKLMEEIERHGDTSSQHDGSPLR